MKKTLLLSMILCLFTLVANAQIRDHGIQGYYKYVGENLPYELKVGSTDPREYTEVGVRSGNNIQIYITEPTTGMCTFSYGEDGAGNCSIVQSYERSVIVSVPKAYQNNTYSTICIECNGKYLEVKMYLIP